MSEFYMTGEEDDRQARCDNCDWKGLARDTRAISDLHERIEPGGEVPVGECPECRALAYLANDDAWPEERWTITKTAVAAPITVVVEGGVIQDILDIPAGAQVVVRDYDVEGIDADEAELETDDDGNEHVRSVWKGGAS